MTSVLLFYRARSMCLLAPCCISSSGSGVDHDIIAPRRAKSLKIFFIWHNTVVVQLGGAQSISSSSSRAHNTRLVVEWSGRSDRCLAFVHQLLPNWITACLLLPDVGVAAAAAATFGYLTTHEEVDEKRGCWLLIVCCCRVDPCRLLVVIVVIVYGGNKRAECAMCEQGQWWNK